MIVYTHNGNKYHPDRIEFGQEIATMYYNDGSIREIATSSISTIIVRIQ